MLLGDGSEAIAPAIAMPHYGQWSELASWLPETIIGDLGEPIYAGLYGDIQNINWDSDAVDRRTWSNRNTPTR